MATFRVTETVTTIVRTNEPDGSVEAGEAHYLQHGGQFEGVIERTVEFIDINDLP